MRERLLDYGDASRVWYMVWRGTHSIIISASQRDVASPGGTCWDHVRTDPRPLLAGVWLVQKWTLCHLAAFVGCRQETLARIFNDVPLGLSVVRVLWRAAEEQQDSLCTKRSDPQLPSRACQGQHSRWTIHTHIYISEELHIRQ